MRARKQIPTLHKSSCAYLKITIFATSSLSCLSYSLTFTLRWLTYLLGTYYRYLWRRQWHPTPVLLPRKSHGRRSLLGCSPWGREELVTTKRLHFHFSLSCIGEGNGNPLQCSCLENPRDGGAWWASVSGVAQSRTRLKRLSSSSRQKIAKSSPLLLCSVC